MKKIIKYIDKPLLLVTLVLFILGLIMVFSASNVTAYMSHAVRPYNYFIKQGVFLLIGFLLFLIMIHFNTKSYGIFTNRNCCFGSGIIYGGRKKPSCQLV